MRTIEFFNIIQGVADAFPVIRASEYRPAWLALARQHCQDRLDSSNGLRFFHAYRCPGIFDIMSQGYIVTCPWDVTIDTNGDGETFNWRVPGPEITSLLGYEPVQWHSDRTVAAGLPVKPGSLRSIIKLLTGWNIIAPTGVKFVIIPLPYPDSYEFESASGILDPGLSTDLSAQIYWNVARGRHTILAGTPLFQILPLTDEKFKLEVRNATASDRIWIQKRRYFLNMQFKLKLGMIKSFYNKIFGKK